MAIRMKEVTPPFPQEVETVLKRVMPPNVPALKLFTTLARDTRLFGKFMASSLLDKGNLSLREREIVILRVTALCDSEYEWGIHVAFFAKQANLSEAEIASTIAGPQSSDTWNPAELALLAACEELHNSSTINDKTWLELVNHFSEEAILEVLMLAGNYKTVSYLTNGLRLEPEPFAARFPKPNTQ